MNNDKQTFQKLIQNLAKDEEQLVLANKQFSNEIFVEEQELVQCCVLADIIFCKVQFQNVNFSGSLFLNCQFEDCKFEYVRFRKSQFENCTFQNCTFQNCYMIRTEFTRGGKLKNSNFLNVELQSSLFFDFEFIQTTFKNTDLDNIAILNVTVQNLTQSIKIDEDNFEKTLRNMNLIIASD